MTYAGDLCILREVIVSLAFSYTSPLLYDRTLSRGAFIAFRIPAGSDR